MQLWGAIAVPSFLIVLTMLQNHFRFKAVEDRLEAIGNRLDELETFMMNTVRDMGKHDKAIEVLEKGVVVGAMVPSTREAQR